MRFDWHNLGWAQAPSPHLMEALRTAQRGNYYSNLLTAWFGQLGIWTIVLPILYALNVGRSAFWPVTLIIATILVLQIMELRHERHAVPKTQSTVYDITRIWQTGCSAAVAYSVALVSLCDAVNIESVVITSLLAFGLCAVAVVSMSFVPAAAASYVMLLLTPKIVALTMSNTNLGLILAGMMTFFGLILVAFIKQGFEVFYRSVWLGVENRDLFLAAKAASHAKSEFLSAMSHELRTPLNAIANYGQLIKEDLEGVSDPQILRDLDGIAAANRHLSKLIDDILDLSKIEAGKIDLLIEEVDLAIILDDIRNIGQPLADQNGNQFSIQVNGVIGMAKTDATRLRQCLVNLVNNANKFTRNGIVSLEVEAEDVAVVFKVTDTGIGIDAEQMARLFQPFTQAESSTTKRFGGTGLGLALTMDLTTMLGGSLEATSVYGHGSVFTLHLPRNAAISQKANRIE